MIHKSNLLCVSRRPRLERDKTIVAPLRGNYRKIPSVWAPVNLRTSSDSVVCIHGNLLSENLVFCMLIISSSVSPNIDGWNIDLWNKLHEIHTHSKRRCQLLRSQNLVRHLLLGTICMSGYHLPTLACSISSKVGFFKPFLAPAVQIRSNLRLQIWAKWPIGTT